MDKLDMFTVIGSLVTIMEFIVRLTPTKTDDGFIQRIGNLVSKFLDSIGVPNKTK